MENQRKLVLASFSQTIADTETKTLFGYNMETIKLQAIRKMFGSEGLRIFEIIQNENPTMPLQVILVMLLSNKDCCLNLRDYMQIKELNLFKKDLTPAIYKEFIKLNVVMLYDLIGSLTIKGEIWPYVYPGFTEFRKILLEKNIDLGIVSSGYERFIIDVFDKYQIAPPLFCVTPEDDFGIIAIDDWTSKNKPSPLLISQALYYWNKYYNHLDRDYMLANTIMIGDDMELDGKMAENSGIPFWYFTSDINNVVLSDNQRSFSNWGQLVNALKDNKLF